MSRGHVRLIGRMHSVNHVAFLCLSPVQIFEQLQYYIMRSHYKCKNGGTCVVGTSFQKDSKEKCIIDGVWGKQGGGQSYLWDYLSSHLSCNLALITTTLGTSTNTPVIAAAKTNPTGMRDKNRMKLWFPLVWWLLFFFLIKIFLLFCCSLSTMPPQSIQNNS